MKEADNEKRTEKENAENYDTRGKRWERKYRDSKA